MRPFKQILTNNITIFAAIALTSCTAAKPEPTVEIQPESADVIKKAPFENASFKNNDFIKFDEIPDGFLVKSLGPVNQIDSLAPFGPKVLNTKPKRNEDCFYSSEAQYPSGTFNTKNRNVLGIYIDENGTIYGMVPDPKGQLFKDLESSKGNRNQWKGFVHSSTIDDYKPVSATGTATNSLDLSLKKRHHVAFKLFVNAWYFNGVPFELKDPVLLTNSPFSVHDITPNNKNAHIFYYRGDSLEPKCRYPFSVNVFSADAVFKTLLKIDPIINDDGGG